MSNEKANVNILEHSVNRVLKKYYDKFEKERCLECKGKLKLFEKTDAKEGATIIYGECKKCKIRLVMDCIMKEMNFESVLESGEKK